MGIHTKPGRLNPLVGGSSRPEENSIRPATYTKRVIAGMIDGLILYFAVITILRFLDPKGLPIDLNSPTRSKIVLVYCYFFLTIVPHWYFSQSMGQAIVGIKVVDEEYQRLKLSTCILRDLFLRPIGVILSLSSMKDGQSFHDKKTNSIVVEAK